MKKVLTIIITVVFLASGVQVTIDRHYCGGMLAAVKVSLRGEKASCGMAQSDSQCSNQPSFTSKCCDDQMSSVFRSNNYFPEYFQVSRTFPDKQVIYFEYNLLSAINVLNTTFFNNDFPPGKNVFSRLTQPDICIFRI